MATAPVGAELNPLIAALRAGTPGLPANAMSTYSFMPNRAPTYGAMPPRAPRAPALLPTLPPKPVVGPPLPPSPTPAPPPPVVTAPSPVVVPPSVITPSPTPLPTPAPTPEPTPEPTSAPTPPWWQEPSTILSNSKTGTGTEVKKPTVTVQEVDVTDTSPYVSDPTEDFSLDQELGIIQQSDVPTVTPAPTPAPPPVEPPTFFNPVNTTTSLNPSVTVNEGLDITPGPAPYTDPAENFDIDRELGIVQQSDVFMGPFSQPETPPASDALFAPTNEIGNANVDYLGTPEQEMQLGMLLEPSAWTMPEPDLSVGLPSAVPAPAAPQPLTDQDLLEMALFDMLAQQNLTRGPSDMVDEYLVER